MTTIVAPNLDLIDIAKHAATDELHDADHKPTEAVTKVNFVGGCVGYVYRTLRNARAVGGSAGWAAARI